jgi:diacylglycerol kinase family enzyme
MLGVGFDAHVVHRLPARMKRGLGRGAYALQILWELGFYRHTPIRVALDGKETQASSIIVSKGRLYGGSFLLAPTACPTKPGFSVVLFDRSSIAAPLLYGAALPLGLLGRAPGVRHARAREIAFVGNEIVPAQADGDPAGWTPISIIDAPAAIPIVVG